MFPHSKFEEYFNVAKDLLMPESAGKPWNNHIKDLVKTSAFKKLLTRMHNVNCTIAYLKQILSLAITASKEELTTKDITNTLDEQTSSSEPVILAGLTLIETCVLIAIKHIQIIYDGQPFNFEMAYHEYDKFLTINANMRRQDRTVVMKAWETLIDLELITPVDRGSKIQKEFKLHSLQILPAVILKSLDGIPQSVREWATSGSYA
jgi:origin recognition complex subunit 4